MSEWEELASGLFLGGYSVLGTTGKASRATASESVIAAKTSGHGMQHRNCSGKGTPIWIGIKTAKHASHLDKGFTGNAPPPTRQHLHLQVLLLSSNPHRFFFIGIVLLPTQQHLYLQEMMLLSNQHKHLLGLHSFLCKYHDFCRHLQS